MMDDSQAARLDLKRRCQPIHGHGNTTPADLLGRTAAWCAEHDVDFDRYGSGSLIEIFEATVSSLLGFAAGRFMPTGKLAQNVAIKVWCERASNAHFGMHPTSHLELHEGRAYQHLFGLRATLVGPNRSPLLASHLRAVPEALSALLVELPIREAGGQLPTWDELEELKGTARRRGIRLHLDGARLWETAAHYGQSYEAICAGFDSVYVSFYKGIGALSGAMLLGSRDFIEEAAVWQRRCGGELYTLAPNIASAAMQFDERLARMPGYYAQAQALATAVNSVDGIATLPATPHTNMMHVFLPWDTELALDARDRLAAETGIWLFNAVRPTDRPGHCFYEWYVGDAASDLTAEQITTLFARLHHLASEA
ncbi:MAG: threonine aldolase [Myxococcota bacterium]|jgi:threonine aldolase